MSNTITCRINERQNGFEGTVSIEGVRSTKLVRSSDGSSVYTTRSGVTQAAKMLASRLSMELEFDDRTKSKKSKSSQMTVESASF